MLIVFILSSLMINCCHGQVKKRFGIVGGTEVGIEDYPYQCAFLANGVLKCGCSIISNDCLLTAGKNNFFRFLKIQQFFHN